MPAIAELTLYPVKSCAGIALQEATIGAAGLAYGGVADREWMIVDANGQFLSQRTHPRMARIRPGIQSEQLILQFPGLTPLALPLSRRDAGSEMPVRVWKDQLPAQDCGPEAAAWLTQALGTPCRLVRFSASAVRLASPKWTRGIDAPNRFSDAFPFLVIAQASLDDLNERLHHAGRPPLPMNRFRPNIVMNDVPAYAEDALPRLQIEGARLELVRACQRCPVPSIDQDTGEKGPDPIDILRTYHSGGLPNGAATFGVHAILQSGEGTLLRVGQSLTLSQA